MAKFSFKPVNRKRRSGASAVEAENEATSSKKGRRLGGEELRTSSVEAVQEEEEEEEGEESEDEEEGEESAGAERGGEDEANTSSQEENKDRIRFTIDPDILDCSVCFEPLRPPLFQCPNGHVACSSCWCKLKNKCHICSRGVSSIRNIAAEKIIESIRVSCAFAEQGCHEMVCYMQKHAHEEACAYAPAVCPVSGCTYNGFEGWSSHLRQEHCIFAKKLNCWGSSVVVMKATEPFLALNRDDDRLFLLLSKNNMPVGHSLSMVCIQPGWLKGEFLYELKATSTKGSLVQLKASVTSMREWKGVHPTDAFLLVPHEFCANGEIVLDVLVRKK